MPEKDGKCRSGGAPHSTFMFLSNYINVFGEKEAQFYYLWCLAYTSIRWVNSKLHPDRAFRRRQVPISGDFSVTRCTAFAHLLPHFWHAVRHPHFKNCPCPHFCVPYCIVLIYFWYSCWKIRILAVKSTFLGLWNLGVVTLDDFLTEYNMSPGKVLVSLLLELEVMHTLAYTPNALLSLLCPDKVYSVVRLLVLPIVPRILCLLKIYIFYYNLSNIFQGYGESRYGRGCREEKSGQVLQSGRLQGKTISLWFRRFFTS